MIRSLTIGLPLEAKSVASINADLEKLLPVARRSFGEAGLDCRTIRMTTPPCGSDYETEGALTSRAKAVESLAKKHGVRWYCLPLDFSNDGSVDVRAAEVVSVIQHFPQAFINFQSSRDSKTAGFHAIEIAREMLKISRLSNNGFDNFRVGASFNCAPNSPFFPLSSHEGNEVAFSFALETTPLALAATEAHLGNIDRARAEFGSSLERLLSQVDAVGHAVEESQGLPYRGADASLAPLPDGRTSVVRVVEGLLGSPMGSHGTLAITAALTDSIRESFASSGARSAGFNGVMYSVLEDPGLASAVGNRLVGIPDLIAYASVCGCGLDMVPIAGHSFPEEIASMLLDIGALSAAARKPLGVRLLPIPGKLSHEFTSFNQDFMCNSRILAAGPHSMSEYLLNRPISIKSSVGEVGVVRGD